MGGRLQRPRGRPPPPLLAAVLGRRWRRRQADAPLRQPHQRLLPGQLTLEPLLLAAQLLHFALGVVSRSARLRGAGSHQTTQGPRLHLVVTRHRDVQGAGRLRRRPRPGQHFQNRRRQALHLAAVLLAQGGAARAVATLRPGRRTSRGRLFLRRVHTSPPSSAAVSGTSRTSRSVSQDRSRLLLPAESERRSSADSPGAGGSSLPSSTRLATTPAGHSGSGKASRTAGWSATPLAGDTRSTS